MITAVEPNVSLATHIRATTNEANVSVVVAPWEEVQLAGEQYDLVVAATSFHWIDPANGLTKVGEQLRPGGWVALWWTLFEDPTHLDDFDQAIQTVLGPSQSIVDPGPAALQIEADARCAALRDAGFVEVRSEILRSIYTFDGAAIRALYATLAIVLRRSVPDQVRVLDALQELVERDFGNLITRTFVTALYIAQAPT
jgi:hypothetical protein